MDRSRWKKKIITFNQKVIFFRINKLLFVFTIDVQSLKQNKQLKTAFLSIITIYFPIKNRFQEAFYKGRKVEFTYLNKEGSLFFGDPDHRIQVLLTFAAFIKHCYTKMLLDMTISLEMQQIFFSLSCPWKSPWNKGSTAHLVSKMQDFFLLYLLHPQC